MCSSFDIGGGLHKHWHTDGPSDNTGNFQYLSGSRSRTVLWLDTLTIVRLLDVVRYTFRRNWVGAAIAHLLATHLLWPPFDVILSNVTTAAGPYLVDLELTSESQHSYPLWAPSSRLPKGMGSCVSHSNSRAFLDGLFLIEVDSASCTN